MCIDVTKLNNGLIAFIDFDKTLTIPDEMIQKTEIVSLSEIKVKGRITKTSDEAYNLNATITGTMILKCAVSLSDVSYPFNIIVDENISNDIEDEENLKINSNLLEIIPIIWENIVLEIPLRVVNQNYTAKTQGEGWSIITEGTEKENGLADIKKLLDVEEEK